jgi:hypothetical protein
MVEKGWLHIQRLNQKFGAICRPEESDLKDAVEFLRVTVQRAATEYLKIVESAIVKYANERFVTPVAKTDDEAVDIHSYLDSYNKVVCRIRQSTTTDIDDPLWINWLHIYQLVRGLWEDRVGNQLTTKSFLYTFLKGYKVKLSDISRTERSPVNTEFWDVLKPGRKTYPYQCPFIKRLNYLRHKKIHERIVNNAATYTSLTFMLDHPRSTKLKSKQPFYVWEGKGGKPLFFLFNKSSGEIEGRKRDRAEDAIGSTGRMRMDLIKANTDVASTEDVKQKARMIRTLLQGIPPKELIHQLFDEYYGHGALDEYVRSRSGGVEGDRANGNKAQPTNEIMCAGDLEDYLTNDPSTLTASWHGGDLPDLFGLDSLRKASSGRAYSFEEDLNLNGEVQRETSVAYQYANVSNILRNEELDDGGKKPRAVDLETSPRRKERSTVNMLSPGTPLDATNPVVAVLQAKPSDTSENEIVEKGKSTKEATKDTGEEPQEEANEETEIEDDEKESNNEDTESEKPEEVVEAVVVTKYDIASYTLQECSEPRDCAICEKNIRKEGVVFKCKGCVSDHVVCEECMQDDEDENFKPNKCKHEEYEDMESYEQCVGPTYWWMNKKKPKKRCCTCGEESKPTHGNPVYYCRKCRIHRVCKGCWKTMQLQETKQKDEDGQTGDAEETGGRQQKRKADGED